MGNSPRNRTARNSAPLPLEAGFRARDCAGYERIELIYGNYPYCGRNDPGADGASIRHSSHDRRPIFDQVGDPGSVPVCHPHAPVRRGMAYLPRFRRAVYAVVRYVDPHPYNTHRIVWTRCDLDLGVCGIGVQNEFGL